MRRHLLLIGSLTLQWPTAVLASGLDAPTVGTAFSNPAVPDAAALYWNPGLLGLLDRTELLLGAGLVVGRAAYQRTRRAPYQHADTLEFKEPISPENLDPRKTGDDRQVSATPVAPFGDAFVAVPIIPGTSVLGLGVYTPYAAVLGFPEDGPQRWQLQEAFITFTHISAGLGFRVTDRIAFGASGSYVFGLAALSKIQDFAALDDFGEALARPPTRQPNDFGADAPTTVRELDVLARPVVIHDATSHGWTFNAGLAVRPTDTVLVGLCYQHGSEADFGGQFTLDLDDDFFTGDLAEVGLQYPPLVAGDARLRFELPRRVQAGVAWDVDPGLGLWAQAAWVQWSVLDRFRIRLDSPDLAQPELGLPPHSAVSLPRRWRDSVHLEVGGRPRLTESLSLLVSAGYQSPASPDDTIDVASPDGHRLLAAVGLGWAVHPAVLLVAHGRLQAILPRAVNDSEHDLGNGTYNLLLGSLGAHAQFRFGGGR